MYRAVKATYNCCKYFHRFVCRHTADAVCSRVIMGCMFFFCVLQCNEAKRSRVLSETHLLRVKRREYGCMTACMLRFVSMKRPMGLMRCSYFRKIYFQFSADFRRMHITGGRHSMDFERTNETSFHVFRVLCAPIVMATF